MSSSWGRAGHSQPGPQRPRLRATASSLALAVLATAASALPAHADTDDTAVAPAAITIPGAPTSGRDDTPVQLSADLYLPTATPAPAVILAHGFGGSKKSVTTEAQDLVEAGFVVLAYTARGFGESTGQISLNAPNFEIADASRIIDHLAGLPEVELDAPGDPVVGVAGGSYGGALALMAAGTDQRVDAIASDITWNDLESALFAQNLQGSNDDGVLKKLWTALFFNAALATPPGQADTCGRLTQQWCDIYAEAATTGTLTDEMRPILWRSSPTSVTKNITAPTLLGGGQADSLFPLDQLNANAEQIRAANPDTPLKVLWHAQGHDRGADESERLRALTVAWFQHYLADGPEISLDFEASLTTNSALSDRRAGSVDVLGADQYPGLFGESQAQIALEDRPQRILAPAGGEPAAITSLPGIGSLGGVLSLLDSRAAPNQSARFASEPLEQPLRIVGASRVSLEVSSDVPRRSALFVGLRIQSGAGAVLPRGLIAPVNVDLGPEPQRIDVELPAVVADVAAGDRLVVTVSTTDQSYRMPEEPALYTVKLAETTLQVPQLGMASTRQSLPLWLWLLVPLVMLIVAVGLLAVLRPRWGKDESRPELADTAFAIEGLVKQYSPEVRAVAGVDFTVPRGAVLGLLGPNGAGKTTTMRMALGLIQPTEGKVFILGERSRPGAPVLSRVGAFVEGPGFLPHLTGAENLDLYWKASGRTGDPHMDEVLDIAGLAAAVNRRVQTYSQGMRQRLGIAQAMLGLPDILVLDEPTNGLDPPQIREMRRVMRDYAQDGRTVVVSSHLLSEVEQTCTDVVVMHRGRVIATGTVEELLAGRSGQHLEDVFMDLVGEDHLANAGPLESEA